MKILIKEAIQRLFDRVIKTCSSGWNNKNINKSINPVRDVNLLLDIFESHYMSFMCFFAVRVTISLHIGSGGACGASLL